MSPVDPSHAWNELNTQIVACERCPRLRTHCQKTAIEKRRAYRDDVYHGRAVPNFGSHLSRLLIVGLAPAAHGANRTGRMFTGDRSGDFLFAALHRAGMTNQAQCINADDGLALIDVTITAAAHCAPPANKPTTEELANCFEYFQTTVALMLNLTGTLALGQLGFNTLWKLYKQLGWAPKPTVMQKPKFEHGKIVTLPSIPRDDSASMRQNRVLQNGHPPFIAMCYHPSQQNTFTGKLTETMMDQLLKDVQIALDA